MRGVEYHEQSQAVSLTMPWQQCLHLAYGRVCFPAINADILTSTARADGLMREAPTVDSFLVCRCTKHTTITWNGTMYGNCSGEINSMQVVNLLHSSSFPATAKPLHADVFTYARMG